MQRIQRQILTSAKLRATPCRVTVVGLLLRNKHALTQQLIEKSLSDRFDRVTVYRTLKVFLSKGVIHKVLDDTGCLKYALCPEVCMQADHHHDHVHFKCTSCGNTACLEEIPVPGVKLPRGFMATEYNLLVGGICSKCQ